MDTPPATSQSAQPSALARIGGRLFGYRLWIGLAVAAGSLEFLEPGNLFGSHEILGRTAMMLLVAAGFALRAWGSAAAGGHTRTATIEAPRLSTGGPYAFVRNPIYTGSMLLGFGAAGFIGDQRALWICAAVFVVLYLTIIPAEETFLRSQFSAEYARYCAAVPRLIPRLLPWRGAANVRINWRAARGELGIFLVVAGIYAALQIEEFMDARYGW